MRGWASKRPLVLKSQARSPRGLRAWSQPSRVPTTTSPVSGLTAGPPSSCGFHAIGSTVTSWRCQATSHTLAGAGGRRVATPTAAGGGEEHGHHGG